MFVVTADIGAEGLEVERTLHLKPQQANPEAGDLILEPVAIRGRIDRLGRDFGFQGRLETSLRLACSRCLELFLLPVDLSFDLVYRAGGKSALDEDKAASRPLDEVGPDDPAVAELAKGRIDLGQLIREQVYLALPLKPLCEATCRGLCPQCGTRLDGGNCGCVTADVDPRWAALKALKDRL